jgi:hypothetical protein
MPMQILNLILHSNTPIYNEMYAITNEHYKKIHKCENSVLFIFGH